MQDTFEGRGQSGRVYKINRLPDQSLTTEDGYALDPTARHNEFVSRNNRETIYLNPEPLSVQSKPPVDLSMINFKCNICGTDNSLDPSKLHREALNCTNCGSCARFRGVVKAVQKFAFNDSEHPLQQEPARDEMKALGMSDWSGYANELARICGFINTYYHMDPFLDVTSEESSSIYRDLDFVISSEVLEHVKAPVSSAFANIYAMLKPGGYLFLTVPYLSGYETIEHFPHLDVFKIVKTGEKYSMVNTRPDGHVEHHDNLSFHGGPGSVLEMRVFGEGDLFSMLYHTGFEVHDLEFDKSIGYFWHELVETPLWRGRPAKAHVLACRKPE